MEQKAAEAKKEELKNLRNLAIIIGVIFGFICVIGGGLGIGFGIYNSV